VSVVIGPILIFMFGTDTKRPARPARTTSISGQSEQLLELSPGFKYFFSLPTTAQGALDTDLGVGDRAAWNASVGGTWN
jgi:hypothetical protein